MVKKNLSIGLVLISIGLMLILLNFKIFALNWISLIISIVLIIYYLAKKNMIHLISGLALLAISTVSLLDQYLFPTIRLTSFIYLYAVGIFGVVSYFKRKSNMFLFLGSIFIALATQNLLQQLIVTNISWFRLILISLVIYITYYIGYKDNGIIWPKYISIIFLILGSISLLYYKGLFNLGLGKILSYLIPIVIIIIGIRIFYITLKERR